MEARKMWLALFAIFLAATSLVNADSASDISYYYTKGISSESIANFEDASLNYKRCYELASENLKTGWYELCKEAYDRTANMKKEIGRNLAFSIPWTFKGELDDIQKGITTQYFLTSKNELVILNVFSPKTALTEEQLRSLVEKQRELYNDSYETSTGETNLAETKMYFLVGESREDTSTIFDGFSYRTETGEVYNIRATLKGNFKSELSALKFQETIQETSPETTQETQEVKESTISTYWNPTLFSLAVLVAVIVLFEIFSKKLDKRKKK